MEFVGLIALTKKQTTTFVGIVLQCVGDEFGQQLALYFDRQSSRFGEDMANTCQTR